MRCLCQPAVNQKGEKNKHLKHEIKQVQLFVYNTLCSRNFQNVYLRPKNEYLFKCGKRTFLSFRFYVRSIMAEFESQKQSF